MFTCTIKFCSVILFCSVNTFFISKIINQKIIYLCQAKVYTFCELTRYFDIILNRKTVKSHLAR